MMRRGEEGGIGHIADLAGWRIRGGLGNVT